MLPALQISAKAETTEITETGEDTKKNPNRKFLSETPSIPIHSTDLTKNCDHDMHSDRL